ncbi:uncharacterized protein [Anabrus simplex]|uniref:uncharacterized protein n=1 Tax=Anabrus simplex TaxID=316456 RepID=UPI0035A27CFA
MLLAARRRVSKGVCTPSRGRMSFMMRNRATPSAASARARAPTGTNSNMKVVVRVRPRNEKDGEGRDIVKVVDEKMLIFDPKESEEPFFVGGIQQKNRNMLKRKNREMQFVFDRVFGFSASNQEVFEGSTKELIKSLLDGFNCSVFVYGATGAGKTFTMLGNKSYPGISYLTMVELYAAMGRMKDDKDFDLSISYLEVYNETVHDLINPSGPLKIHEDGTSGTVVSGIQIHRITNAEELFAMLEKGNSNRTQHPTDANAESSRSHAVFQVMIRIADKLSNQVKIAKLLMIDLAGSERGAVTGGKGKRFCEGSNINKSLLALGNCVNALADGQKHIPYRDSKLTRLLKDSLGGNCKTVMIANVSPSSKTFEETFNTLNYATRAKKINTKIRNNVYSVDMHINQYIRLVEELRLKITTLEKQLEEEKSKKGTDSVPLSEVPSTSKIRDIAAENESVTKWKEKLNFLFEKMAITQSDVLKLDAEIRLTEHKIMVKKEIQKRLQKIRTTASQFQNCNRAEVLVARLERQLEACKRNRSIARSSVFMCEGELLSAKSQIEEEGLLNELKETLDLHQNMMEKNALSIKMETAEKLATLQHSEIMNRDKIILEMASTLEHFYTVLVDSDKVTGSMKDKFLQNVNLLAGVKEVCWKETPSKERRSFSLLKKVIGLKMDDYDCQSGLLTPSSVKKLGATTPSHYPSSAEPKRFHLSNEISEKFADQLSLKQSTEDELNSSAMGIEPITSDLAEGVQSSNESPQKTFVIPSLVASKLPMPELPRGLRSPRESARKTFVIRPISEEPSPPSSPAMGIEPITADLAEGVQSSSESTQKSFVIPSSAASKLPTPESPRGLRSPKELRKTYVIPPISEEPSTPSFPARTPRKTYFTPLSQIAESMSLSEPSNSASSELTSRKTFVIPSSPTTAEQAVQDWPKGPRTSSEISRKTFVIPSSSTGVLPTKPELPWGTRSSNEIARKTFAVPFPLEADGEAKQISPDCPIESSYLHLNTRRTYFSPLTAMIDESTTDGPSSINSCEQIAEKTFCIPSSPLAAKPKLCNQTGESSSHQLVSHKTIDIPSPATVQSVSVADPLCPDSSELEAEKTSLIPVTTMDLGEGCTRNHKNSSSEIDPAHELHKNSLPLGERHSTEGSSPDISSSEGTEKCHRKTETKYRPYNLRSSCVGCGTHSLTSPDICGNKEHLCSNLKQTTPISLPSHVEEEPQNTRDDKTNILETTVSSCQYDPPAVVTPTSGDGDDDILNRTFVTPSPSQPPYDLPNIDAPETETSVSETFSPAQAKAEFPIIDPNSTFVMPSHTQFTACEKLSTLLELNKTFEGENTTQDLNRTFVTPAPSLPASESDIEGTNLRTLQTMTSFALKPSIEFDKTFINPPPDALEYVHTLSEHDIGCDRDLNNTFVLPVKVVSEKTASTIKKRIIPLGPRSQSRVLADRNKLPSGTPAFKGAVDVPKNTPVSLDVKKNMNKENKPIYRPNLPPRLLVKMGTVASKPFNKPLARPPVTYRPATGVVKTELSRERTRLVGSHPYVRPEVTRNAPMRFVHNAGPRRPL